MRKFIGTITIILVLYLGFFGSQTYNIKPFIRNWWNSDKSTKVKNASNEILNKVKENTTETTDSTIKKDTI